MKTLSLATAALAVAAMFGPTACGGDGPGAASGPRSQADRDRMQKFVQCMRDHGIDVPDAPSDAGGDGPQKVVTAPGSSARLDAAHAACAKYASHDEVGEDVSEADQDRALRKAECLREQGINAKDPEPGTAVISVEEGPGDTPEKLVAAYTTCNEQISGG